MANGIAGFHTLCYFAELAAASGHVPAAKQLLPLLEPYADQLDADQALCTGPVAYYLGVLATTLGDWEQADAWLGRAARVSEQVDAARWCRRIRLAQARLLLARGAVGDADEAHRLLAATASAVQAAGQHAVAFACRHMGE